jgi:hypothetical protein
MGMNDPRTPSLKRHHIKGIICGNSRAKDTNIRRALIDMWGGDAATKKGGPLHGISTHAWQALAVAVAYTKVLEHKESRHEG